MTMLKWGLIIFTAFSLATFAEGNHHRKSLHKHNQISLHIHRKLKLLNKPAIKSIKSEDGDIIDCVDVYKQPALDNPLLKGHVIQMKPSFKLEDIKKTNESIKEVSQTWRKNGSCPEGTIPIRRVQEKDLLRAASLDRFGMKYPHNLITQNVNKSHVLAQQNNTSYRLPYRANRSEAVILTVGYNYIGVQGEINVWNPKVDLRDDFTTAQMWAVAGPGDNYESVESGWMVNPKLYGDTRTRFFIHWTADAAKKTGCFDLTCSGFVQTNKDVALGATLEPISSMYGKQYELPVALNLDPYNGNWWVVIHGNIAVGYFPKSLFYNLDHSAISVQWGGEVYSGNVRKTPHTKTFMGSGEYGEAKYGAACYINHIRITDWSLKLKYPEWVATTQDEVYCYNGINYREGIIGEPTYFFGGRGQSHLCP